jgi:hypothetical protein
MRKFIFIPENGLLLWLTLLPVFVSVLYGNTALDIHRHDTYGMVHIEHRLFFWLITFTLISYFGHLLLRIKQKRQKKVCNVHIILTIIASAAVILNFYSHVPLKPLVSEAGYAALTYRFSFCRNLHLHIFAGLQGAFWVYSFFTVQRPFRAKRSG